MKAANAKPPSRFLGVSLYGCLVAAILGSFIFMGNGMQVRADDLTVDHMTVNGDGAVSNTLTFLDDWVYINGNQMDWANLTSVDWHIVFSNLSSSLSSTYAPTDPVFNSLAVTTNLSIGGNLSSGTSISAGASLYYSNFYAPYGIYSTYTLNGNYIDSSEITDIWTSWEWAQNGASGASAQMDLDSANFTLHDAGSGKDVAFSFQYGGIILTTNGTPSLVPFFYTVDNSANHSLDIGGGAISLRTSSNSTTGPESIVVGGALFGQTGNYSSPGNALFVGNAQNITLDPANESIAFASGRTFSATNFGPYTDTSNIALGTNVTALGVGALAISTNSTANGTGAIAIVGGNATGNFAVAMGANSTVSADNAIAMAGGTASANGALAIGSNAIANGTNAVAIGTEVTAQTWNTVTIGRYSAPITGCATARVATDPAFIVGIGENTTARANGLVILNNGNITFSNTTTLINPSYVSPTSSTQPLELQVNEQTVFNGTVTFSGKLRTSGPQGDIPVGQFDGSNSY